MNTKVLQLQTTWMNLKNIFIKHKTSKTKLYIA